MDEIYELSDNDVLISISNDHIKTSDFEDDDVVALCNVNILKNIINDVDYEDNILDIIKSISQYPTIFTTYKDFKQNKFILYDKYSSEREFLECDNRYIMSYKYVKYITNNLYCSVDKLKEVINIEENISFIKSSNEIIDTFFVNNNEYININNLYHIFDKNISVRSCNNYNKLRYMLDKEMKDINDEMMKDMKRFKNDMLKQPISEIYDKNRNLLCGKLVDMFNKNSKYKCNSQLISDEFKDFNSKLIDECIRLEIKCFKDNINTYPFIDLFSEIRICINKSKDIHYLSVKTVDIEELYNKTDVNFKYCCLSDEQKEDIHKYVRDIFPLNDETLNKISYLLHNDDVIIFARDFFSSSNPSIKYSYKWIREKLEELNEKSNRSFFSRFIFW